MSKSYQYRLEKVSKNFISGQESLQVLKNINLKIKPGDSIAIIGASGSGKSTLLHLMGGLDKPSQGDIYFYDKKLSEFTETEKALFRNEQIGFVFQFHYLLPEFTVLENVAMPAIIKGLPLKRAFYLAKTSLQRVNFTYFQRNVALLSGGEKQRVAIARAICLEPAVILADEPTGNLDQENGQKIGELLSFLNQELRTTLVVVTHNLDLANLMQVKYQLRAGELHEI